MKKLSLFLLLAVAGCTAQDTATSISTASQSVNGKIAGVQSYAAKVCRYVPTAATVLSIFNSGMGSDVAVVANAICNAVTTAPLADGGPRASYVNGIRIRGHRV